MEVKTLGVLLFMLLVILVLAVLLGAGGYSVRRYWSPAGSEVVEMGGNVAGAGGIAAAILALLALVLIFFGFTQWNWFGTREIAPTTTNNPAVASPLPQAGAASPSAQASASPSASPSK